MLTGLRAVRAFVVRWANTPSRLVGLVVGSWLLFAAIFAALSPYGFFDSLYFGTVVHSTLGFGDVLPIGYAERSLVMAYLWFSIYFVLPAAIFHVGDSFLASRQAFSEQEQAIVKGEALLAQQERMERAQGRPVSLDEAAKACLAASKACAEDDKEFVA